MVRGRRYSWRFCDARIPAGLIKPVALCGDLHGFAGSCLEETIKMPKVDR